MCGGINLEKALVKCESLRRWLVGFVGAVGLEDASKMLVWRVRGRDFETNWEGKRWGWGCNVRTRNADDDVDDDIVGIWARIRD